MKKDWKETLTKDLTFIYDTLKENHPGYHDNSKEGKHFKTWLKKGYDKAIRKTQRTNTKKAYEKNLQTFIKGFNDVHLRLEQKEKEQKNKKEKTASIKEYEKEKTWIHIPTFSPQKQKEKKALQNVINKMPTLREHKTIIIDLRKTKGGSAAWGEHIIQNLYTKKYLETKKLPGTKRYTKIRASKENLEHFKTFSKQKTLPTKTKKYLEDVNKKMKQALKQKKKYITLQEQKKVKKNKNKEKNPVKANIIVITDNTCRSASLLFVDKILSLPNTTHIGQPTAHDSPYSEIRKKQLPSKKYTLVLPTNIRYHFRTKKAKKGPLQPTHHIKNLNDTKGLKKKIEKILKEEKTS